MSAIAQIFSETKRVGASLTLVKFLESHCSAVILQQLIFWHYKSKHPGNAFYLTAKELGDQVGLTERQIKYQVNKLEDRKFIERKVSQINDRKTTWFWVNTTKINFELTEFLKANTPAQENSYPQITPPPAPDFVGKDNIVLSESTKVSDRKDNNDLSSSIHKDLHKDQKIYIGDFDFLSLGNELGHSGDELNTVIEEFINYYTHISKITTAEASYWQSKFNKWCASSNHLKKPHKAKQAAKKPIGNWIEIIDRAIARNYSHVALLNAAELEEIKRAARCHQITDEKHVTKLREMGFMFEG